MLRYKAEEAQAERKDGTTTGAYLITIHMPEITSED